MVGSKAGERKGRRRGSLVCWERGEVVVETMLCRYQIGGCFLKTDGYGSGGIGFSDIGWFLSRNVGSPCSGS